MQIENTFCDIPKQRLASLNHWTIKHYFRSFLIDLPDDVIKEL